MRRELLIIALVTAAASTAGGCLEPRDPPPREHESGCTTCHGSPRRGGPQLSRSAPPFDVSARTDIFSRGVGAHTIHLSDSPTHAAVACEQCHVVPEHTDDVGHADTELPAELVFGELASQAHAPSYDDETGSCSDTYCHGGNAVAWIPTAEPHQVCGSCHSLPPAAPHPQSSDCSTCHAEVIDAAGMFLAPEKHVDGIVQQNERCDSCHGSGELGAPPADLSGRTDPTSIGVGAHQIHLDGGASARPVACSDCHQVPVRVSDDGHLDTSPHAELSFAGVAVASGHEPLWDRDALSCSDSWCHGPSAQSSVSPRWVEPGALSCNGCHSMPPQAPHPQMDDCARCHQDVIDAQGSIIDRSKHVNGVVDVSAPSQCDSCHGSGPLGAPPAALDGSTDISAPGVGAHQVHLIASGRARPVTCQECHLVPTELLSFGHVDSARPAELTFSGVAVAYGASPNYDGVRCSDSWCHGGTTVFGFPSGGATTEPVWTTVDGSQSYCNSCHAMPPTTPLHPPGPVLCSGCHSNVTGLSDFIDPLLHINGVVDL
jgi:predicted CxxxxCH...CXXCH cytochrome family protein